MKTQKPEKCPNFFYSEIEFWNINLSVEYLRTKKIHNVFTDKNARKATIHLSLPRTLEEYDYENEYRTERVTKLLQVMLCSRCFDHSIKRVPTWALVSRGRMMNHSFTLRSFVVFFLFPHVRTGQR